LTKNFIYMSKSFPLLYMNIHYYTFPEILQVFWSVVGDAVSAMCVMLPDATGTTGGTISAAGGMKGAGGNFGSNPVLGNDGPKIDLIVATEDEEITGFQIVNSELVYPSGCTPISETDVVVQLCSLSPKLFAYALKNGTVGVYKVGAKKAGNNMAGGAGGAGGSGSGDSGAWATRLWRLTSKNKARSLAAMMNEAGSNMSSFSNGVDANGAPSAMAGAAEGNLVIGWAHGKIEVRNSYSGALMYKETTGWELAGLGMASYLSGASSGSENKPNIVMVTPKGGVHGFSPEGAPKTAGGDSSQNQNQQGGKTIIAESASVSNENKKKKTQNNMGWKADENEIDEAMNDDFRKLLAEKQNLQTELDSFGVRE
jgi:hypothetical protein